MGKHYGGSQEVQPKAKVLLLEGKTGTAGDAGKGILYGEEIRLPSLNVVKVKNLMKMKFQTVNGWMDRK